MDMDITYLFVINGYQCEVTIPSYSNVFVMKNENSSDWEGWKLGIDYFENHYKKPISECFDYLCLINAGAIGPIMENDVNTHWLLPFYNKMVKDNAIACSPCLSFFTTY